MQFWVYPWRMSLNLKGFYTAAVAVLCALSASAAFASDFWSSRTASLGGAGHAGPLLNDAIYLNPSYVSLLPTYGLSGNYFNYSGDPGPAGHGFNFSIQDGRSELFQAGVGYTNRPDASILNVGASKSFIQRTGVGLGAKFIFPKGSSKMLSDTTFSFTGVPSDFIQLSFIVDNLIESADEKALGFYREFILGTKVNVNKILLIYIDPHLVPDDPAISEFGYEAGVEWPIFQDFFLRVGTYRAANVAFANIRGHGYSFGLGWIAPRLSLDYGFVRNIDPASFNGHLFGATVYF